MISNRNDKKEQKYLKKTKRVSLPIQLHLWLKRRATERGDYLQNIVIEAIQQYKISVEKKKD